jgi:hypothetical protein
MQVFDEDGVSGDGRAFGQDGPRERPPSGGERQLDDGLGASETPGSSGPFGPAAAHDATERHRYD